MSHCLMPLQSGVVIFVSSGPMLLQPAGHFPGHSGGDHGGSLFFSGMGLMWVHLSSLVPLILGLP